MIFLGKANRRFRRAWILREQRDGGIKEGGREKEWNLDASLMAKDWIESRDWEKDTEVGDQTGEQYSRIGQTKEV